jgi:hypothetical protein
MHRRRFSPFLYYDVERPYETSTDEAQEAVYRRFKFWPLFSSERRDSSFRCRGLELWPFSRNPRPVERSWAPWWTLWHHVREGGDVDTEVLWGLYRRTQRGAYHRRHSLFPVVSWERKTGTADEREWEFLKGLVGYRREGSRKSFRLLYFLRWGQEEDTP